MRRPAWWLVAFLALVIGGGQLSVAGEQIVLKPEMLINLSGQKAPEQLIDEQDAVGDPRQADAPAPKRLHKGNWINAELYYPLAIVVDFESPHAVSDICFFDGQGSGRLTVEARGADRWQPLFVDGLEKFQQWSRHTVETKTRYLRFTFEKPGADVGELVVFGSRNGDKPAPPRPVKVEPATMDKFIGVNGFVDDPIERLAATGHVREYHNWQWDEGNDDRKYAGYPDTQLAWSPSWVSGPGWGWDFDDYYRRLKAAGIDVAPCLQNGAPFMVKHDGNRADQKPVADGADPTLPESYVVHANYLFQFAARYGGTKVDFKLLKLKTGQPRVSGLGLVHYLENWNEPDKWWRGRAGFFSPFELSAMCSADYDGHRQAMGREVGVKNADPKMQFVMAGLAAPEVQYLKAMKLWSDLNRDGQFPADVINLHHYSTDADEHQGNATIGVSPEADHLRERFAKLVEYRDQQLPGKPLWVSEFGYDTNPKSPFRAPAIGETPADETQARWIVRSYLALAAAGVDRAQLFMLRDVKADDAEKFNSSGLTGEMSKKHPPKASWFYVAAMRRALASTRFDKEVASGNSKVLVYAFRDADAKRTVYAVWSPTSDNNTVKQYELPIKNKSGAEVVSLVAGKAQGASREVAAGDAVKLDVNESPVFVHVR